MRFRVEGAPCHGPIVSHKAVHLTLAASRRRPKPFAFVEFLDYRDAQDAKDEWDRREFHGRVIEVVFAQQKR